MRVALATVMILALAPSGWGAPKASAVEWQSYGPAALQRARREGKPLFLLITATWCQWCHTYERESLYHPEVAALLNSRYVPVWVDFDQRPDVAAHFPGRGLPRTVILNPAGGFEASVEGFIPRAQLHANLQKTLQLLAAMPPAPARPAPTPASSLTPAAMLRVAAAELDRLYDPIYHGFGREAKLPYPGILSFLLEGDQADRSRAVATLHAIGGTAAWQKQLGGGLFDPHEGGFFRYSTRRNWSEPHVEKLLGLNAQLAGISLQVYRQTKSPQARSWAEATLRYLEGRLGAGRGAYYASQAADPAYHRLPPAARRTRPTPSVDRRHFAAPNAQMALTLLEAQAVLGKPAHGERAKQVLAALAQRIDARGAIAHDWTPARESNLRGLLDDQAWTALAMLEAWNRTKQQAYRKDAEALLDFISRELRVPAGYRMSQDGPIATEANAAAALAFERGYRLTGKPEYRRHAQHALVQGMERDLEGGYGWLAARRLAARRQGGAHGR